MIFQRRKYPYKKLYLDDKLVSEYYDPLNKNNYGDVELDETTLIINGKTYTGSAWWSMVYNEDKSETQVIRFVTDERTAVVL